MLQIKSYEREEIYQFLKKRRNTPKTSNDLNENLRRQIQHIRELYSRGFKPPYTKMWSFVFFANCKTTDMCLFVVFITFFLRGDHVEPGIIGYWENAQLLGNQSSRLPQLFFFKVVRSKFEDSHFVKHRRKI
jgi:hypothetical protein